MPRQLAFDLPGTVNLGAEDYLRSESNRAVLDLIATPDRWPDGKLVLVGPEASGKSHLARIFAARTGATAVRGPTLPAGDPTGTSALVIDDADQLPNRAAEDWVFHAHNGLRSRGPLLLTARSAPARWRISLPDLSSRLMAAQVTEIPPPDEDLLFGLLAKHFSDRQLAVSLPALNWLTRHIERSHAAAARAVARLDTAALERGRQITREFAKAVLDRPRSDGA